MEGRLGFRNWDFGFRKAEFGKRKAKKAGWLGIEDLRILKEGVGGFFAADGGGGAVAGENDGLIRKGEDFFTDAGKKEVAISSRQVPAAHAIGKEDVAAEKLASGGKIEAEAAGAVAGNEEEFGSGPGGGDGTGLFQQSGGADRAEALGEAEGEHGIGLETEKGGVGMVVDRAAGPVGEVGGVPEVVPVAVGEEEGVGLEFFLFEEVEKTLGGIDGEAVAVEVEEVGVGGGEAAAVAQGFRHENSPFSLDKDED